MQLTLKNLWMRYWVMRDVRARIIAGRATNADFMNWRSANLGGNVDAAMRRNYDAWCVAEPMLCSIS